MTNYILVDTSKLNNQNNSQFTFYLNKVINIKSYIKINTIIIPKTNFTINSTIGNNVISINFNNNNEINNIIIPSSYYTPLSLCQYINNYLNAAHGFNCSYNTSTYQITFYATSYFSIDLSQSNLYKNLGMKQQIYNSYHDITGINFTLPTGIVLFNNPLYVNLSINNIVSDNLISSNNINSSFILPWAEYNFGDVANWNDKNYSMKLNVDNKTITQLDIILKDDQGNIFDNNNSNYIILLEYN